MNSKVWIATPLRAAALCSQQAYRDDDAKRFMDGMEPRQVCRGHGFATMDCFAFGSQ